MIQLWINNQYCFQERTQNFHFKNGEQKLTTSSNCPNITPQHSSEFSSNCSNFQERRRISKHELQIIQPLESVNKIKSLCANNILWVKKINFQDKDEILEHPKRISSLI
jgi:hypothetical protein